MQTIKINSRSANGNYCLVRSAKVTWMPFVDLKWFHKIQCRQGITRHVMRLNHAICKSDCKLKLWVHYEYLQKKKIKTTTACRNVGSTLPYLTLSDPFKQFLHFFQAQWVKVFHIDKNNEDFLEASFNDNKIF